MADKVVLIDSEPSMFGMRARIALALKGVKYEHKFEDLPYKKSPLLLEMNPINKQVPVLIHNGRPICESVIIVEYIDEVWSDGSPLLPSDPYERSQARFWANYVDSKVYAASKPFWAGKKEQFAEAKKGFVETMHPLEQTLGDKPFFAGQTFGLVDIALVGFTGWFHAFDRIGNLKFEESCPKLGQWARRMRQQEIVSKCLTDDRKIEEFVHTLRGICGAD